MTDWFDELAQWLRIPSISADDAHAGDVIRAGEWARDFIRAAGGEAEVVDWKGQPLVIGEIPASASESGSSAGGPEATGRPPTVLCYGHFDVQPPDPLELWDSPPFEPEIRDGQLYGRGVADDKGQLYLLLAAARDLAAAGELPVNVRFALDGEEETGGHSIVEWVGEDSGPADAAIIFDTGMIARDRPAFNVATRGVQYFHVTLRTGRSDLHSGMFGGAAMNAAHALIRTLDQLVAVDGRLVEPLRAGVLSPSDTELADWRALPPGAGELSDQGATPADPTAADEFYLRTFAEPSLDVNGIDSGSPYLQKTVIPIRADANVSIRIVAGQRGDEIAGAFERLVHAAAPEGASVEVSLLSGAEPGVVPPDSPAIQLGLDAFESALGVRPLLIRSGGTLPIVAALSERDVPTIITGFSLPDAQIHAPNERLPADYIPQGIAAARALFTALGRL